MHSGPENTIVNEQMAFRGELNREMTFEQTLSTMRPGISLKIFLRISVALNVEELYIVNWNGLCERYLFDRIDATRSL